MPTLANLRKQFLPSSDQETNDDQTGEVMIVDKRAYLSPSQQVERKLRGTLDSNGQLGSLRISSIHPYTKPR